MNINSSKSDAYICGSGHVSNECSLNLSNVTKLNFPWHSIRQTESSVVDKHLLPYVFDTLPSEIFNTAFEDLLPKNVLKELDDEHFFSQFVVPWILFNWVTKKPFDSLDYDLTQTIAMNYYQRHQGKLSKLEKQFIYLINKTYYSFYSILAVEPGEAVIVKDLLLDKTHTINEIQGQNHLKKGEIIFGRTLNIENQTIFVGMAPMVLPAKNYIELLEFKNLLIFENDNCPLTEMSLNKEFSQAIFDYFFDLVSFLNHPKMPRSLNLDEDLLVFSKSQFKLEMLIEVALHRLLPMTLSRDYRELLTSAQKSKNGRIIRAEFFWIKKGDKRYNNSENTILGRVIIEEDKLFLETNSENRTEKGKKLLLKYLGNNIQFQNTLLETPEQRLMMTLENKKSSTLTSKDLLPLIQRDMRTSAQNFWEVWFNKPIPALDNQTPLKASKSEDGKARLETLLAYYEGINSECSDSKEHHSVDVEFLRKRLRLREVEL